MAPPSGWQRTRFEGAKQRTNRSESLSRRVSCRRLRGCICREAAEMEGVEKPCVPDHKKDFGAPRSCSGFDDIFMQHDTTARNDGERDGLVHQVYCLHRCGSFGLSSSQDPSIHPAPLARPFSKGPHDKERSLKHKLPTTSLL